jgi:L-aspartate oxidase
MPEEADRVDVCEVRNLATVGAGLVAAAIAREESRGCHTRTDFPETSPAFARRLVLA